METQLIDFLPALPIEGPPLPRFLGVRWPGKSTLPEEVNSELSEEIVLFQREEPPNHALAPEPLDHNPALDASSELIPLVRE